MAPRHNHPAKQQRKSQTETDSFVRVIGGEWRSRKLVFPESEGLRPTPDRVRETLFNWLQGYTAGARCLDLFSGSGALSFEALSRGAAHATLIDASGKVCQFLKENLHTLKAQNAEVLQLDAANWLSQQALTGTPPFDLVFLDPPFNKGFLEPTCRMLEENQILADGAMVYIESETTLGVPQVPENWSLHREKQAGQVSYRLYKRDL